MWTEDEATRVAVDRASRHQIEDKACFSVYLEGETIYYVRASEAAPPKDARLICIAQRWDWDTVQVRYPGARSEWVKV